MTLGSTFLFLGIFGFLLCQNYVIAQSLPAPGVCGTDCIYARYVASGPTSFGVFGNNVSTLLSYVSASISTNPCAQSDACYNAPATCNPNIHSNAEIYNCTCMGGYTADLQQIYNFTCTDIDECSNSTLNNCDSNAICTNSPGTFSCACKPGYTGDGLTCTDIDHCVNHTCGANTVCTDGVLNHTCACLSGFEGDAYANCTDIDECLTTPCGTNSNCSNTIGSYTCACHTGFNSSDNTNCVDIDYCSTNPCVANADCTDGLLNHTCLCKTGFNGDPYTACTDIDECTTGTPCDANANCTNNVGSFSCACNSPYSGNGLSCTLIRSMQFDISCTNLTFVAGLGGNTDVTNVLTLDITALIATVDAAAGVVGIDYFFYNTSSGDAGVTVNATITNGTKVATDFLSQLSSLVLNGECNGTASADECTLNTHTCGSTDSCIDSMQGFCCVHDLIFRGSITGADIFNVNLTDLSHADSTALSAEIVARVTAQLITLDPVGCSSSLNVTVEAFGSGSTIAVILITAQNTTYTVEDIATALAALNGVVIPGLGTVSNSGDFDECTSNLTQFNNCSAFATCLNANATYSCNCNSTYYDNSTAAALAGTVCITPVIAECQTSSMSISVLTAYYTAQSISTSALRFLNASCNTSTHATTVGDFLQFTLTDFNSCGSLVSDNGTHILVSNNLTNVPDSGIFTGPDITVPFACAFPKNVSITSGFNGSVSPVNFPSVAVIGSFTLEFGLFDSTYTTQYPATKTYGSQDIIYGMVSVANPVSGVSVKVLKCYGTPTTDATKDQFVFLENGCPVTTSVDIKYTSISNGNGNARFSFQTFFYTETNEIYLHCDIAICTGQCQPSCTSASGRRRRQVVEQNDELVVKTVTVVIEREISDREQQNIDRIYEQNLTAIIVGSIIGLVVIVVLALIVVLVLRKRQAQKFDDYDLTTVNTHNTKPIM